MAVLGGEETGLNTSDYDYVLPEELIAVRPPARREEARMMVIDRVVGSIEHRSFRDLPELLRPEDLLVMNDTRVMKARLFSEDGKIELLLLEPRDERTWISLVRPGRKCKVGSAFRVASVRAEVLEILEGGERVVRFDAPPDLQRYGSIPLPPYMRRDADVSDAERYQTVYAREEEAVAAPTAGLHFTSEVLAGLPHAFVTLHVGAGTFRPVSVPDLRDHPMHEERFAVSAKAAQRINAAKSVAAVGTTVVRVLESLADEQGIIQSGEGRTSIFIYPPYRFRRVEALLTNFHLPRSTLLILVSAFAGRELVLEAYHKAVEMRYRFYSYGDCMWIR